MLSTDAISLNTATTEDINQLNDINSFDIDNNYTETNDDFVFYSEDSLIASTNSIQNSKAKNLFKPDYNNLNNYINYNLQIFSMVSEIDEGTACLDCGSKCSGFAPHDWKNICKNCRCPRDCHDLRFKGYVTAGEKLALDNDIMAKLRLNENDKYSILEKGFTWQPAGLTYKEVLLFFDNYPQDQIPRLGSHGEKWREKALMYQMPKQDISKEHCRFINNENALNNYEKFMKERNENALDIGLCLVNSDEQEMVCSYCNNLIEIDSVYVNSLVQESSINGDIQTNQCFHPSCFRCSTCDELLVDLVHCIKNGHVYCLRHYAELLRPRCNACDEVRSF